MTVVNNKSNLMDINVPLKVMGVVTGAVTAVTEVAVVVTAVKPAVLAVPAVY